MSDLIAAALFLGLICAAAVCFRVSEWHSSESEFWSDVAMWVRIDPARDAEFRPLLMWAREHRPSVLRRLVGWQSPDARRANQEAR